MLSLCKINLKACEMQIEIKKWLTIGTAEVYSHNKTDRVVGLVSREQGYIMS